MTLAIPFLAIILVVAFCLGEDVDRWCIAGGLIFAVSMAGGVPTYSKGESIDA